MIDREFTAFSEWFDVLAVTHRLSGAEDVRSKMKAEYFDVLRSYPFNAVESAYQTLRRKTKKWPVPADWLEALPPFGSVGRLPPLLPSEQREIEAAEALGYEAATFCHCAACERASVTHLIPRYVPLLDAHGALMARQHPIRQGRPALLGRWLHGQELRDWYAARSEYYSLKVKFDARVATERGMVRTVEGRLTDVERAARATIAAAT